MPKRDRSFRNCETARDRLVYRALTGTSNRDFLEAYRHADMAARKSEAFVKPLRVDAAGVGQQLDQLAASGAGLRHGPLHQLLADAAAAAVRGDADILDQAS